MAQTNKKPSEKFSPVLRFAVCSDIHIKEPGDKACEKFIKCLRTANAAAEQDAFHPNLDALIVAGDTANSGTKEQFDAFFDILAAEKKEETEFWGILAKYHDCGQGRNALEKFSDRTGKPCDWHSVINGFHFIGISVCRNETVFHYSEVQKQWLDREIAGACEDTPDKPVFVIQHEHVRDTVFGSTLFDGWGEIYFTDILKKYPRVIHISGHSHYPAADPRAIWQGDFTALNDGGLSFFEFTFDNQRKYRPADADSMAQFLLIEADQNNTVRVCVYDLFENTIRAEYLLPYPCDPSAFPYGTEVRAARSAAPVFAGKTASAERTENGCILSFAPASTGDDDAVFLYRLTVSDKCGKTVLTDKCLSDYYNSSIPGNVTFSVSLPHGHYRAELTAESVWGRVSKHNEITFDIF